MERPEAEAIYDAGREACVEMLLKLAGQGARHEERLARLEESSRRDSRNSSVPPSADPPKTRAERRTQAKAKAKEWAKKAGAEQRTAGAQPGHIGSGRTLAPPDKLDEIIDHYPTHCGCCGHAFTDVERVPSRRRGTARWQSFPRSRCSSPSIARTGWVARTAAPEHTCSCPNMCAPRRSGPGCRRRS